MKRIHKNVYFDFDGVLAEWRTGISEEEIYKKDYFYNLNPQENIITAAKKLMERKDVSVYGLTCYISDTAKQDKLFWAADFFPELKPSKIIFVPNEEKSHKWDYIHNKDDQDVLQILVDDHTPNLLAFEKAGGYGIKCMNNANGKHGFWQGRCIFADDPYAWAEMKKSIDNIDTEEKLKRMSMYPDP